MAGKNATNVSGPLYTCGASSTSAVFVCSCVCVRITARVAGLAQRVCCCVCRWKTPQGRHKSVADAYVIMAHHHDGWVGVYRMVSTTLKFDEAESVIRKLHGYVESCASSEGAQDVRWDSCTQTDKHLYTSTYEHSYERAAKTRRTARPSAAEYGGAADELDENLKACNPDFSRGALHAPPCERYPCGPT